MKPFVDEVLPKFNEQLSVNVCKNVRKEIKIKIGIKFIVVDEVLPIFNEQLPVNVCKNVSEENKE